MKSCPTPVLAKLGPPQLSNVVKRQRLFNTIDVITRPLTWVGAPGGAGKTTLIASYLLARKRQSIWYQVDREDADPAGMRMIVISRSSLLHSTQS